MLDVIHYLFEEDTTHSTGEQAEAQSTIRRQIYSTMYHRTYKYGLKPSSARGDAQFTDFTAGGDDYDLASAEPAAQWASKPYMPPTEFNPGSDDPFAGVLREKPLG